MVMSYIKLSLVMAIGQNGIHESEKLPPNFLPLLIVKTGHDKMSKNFNLSNIKLSAFLFLGWKIADKILYNNGLRTIHFSFVPMG